jgi:hypothetical protein
MSRTILQSLAALFFLIFTIHALGTSPTSSHSYLTPKTLPGDVSAFYAEIILEKQFDNVHSYYNFGAGRIQLTSMDRTRFAALITFAPNMETSRQITIGYPWEKGIRYKFFVSRETLEGKTIYSAYVGQADQKTWSHIGQIELPGIQYLTPPVGTVQAFSNSGAAAFGQVWVESRQYGWQPIHVLRYRPTSNLENIAEIYQTNMVRVQINADRQSQSHDETIFEFDRTADTFPVLPK